MAQGVYRVIKGHVELKARWTDDLEINSSESLQIKVRSNRPILVKISRSKLDKTGQRSETDGREINSSKSLQIKVRSNMKIFQVFNKFSLELSK